MRLAEGCRILNISPQAIYQYLRRRYKRAQELSIIKQWVQEYRMFMPRIGGRKLYWLIKSKLTAHKIQRYQPLGSGSFNKQHRSLDDMSRPKIS